MYVTWTTTRLMCTDFELALLVSPYLTFQCALNRPWSLSCFGSLNHFRSLSVSIILANVPYWYQLFILASLLYCFLWLLIVEMCILVVHQRTKSSQRWMKLRTTVQLTSAIASTVQMKKSTVKREDSFIQRFSTRMIPETQVL